MAKRSATGEDHNIRPVFRQLLGDLPAHDLFELPQLRRQPHRDVLIGQLADLTRGQKLSKTVERKHHIRIFGPWSRIEVTRHEADIFRGSIAWNKPVSKIIIAERLHALGIRTRRTDEGDAAFFQIALQRCVWNTTTRDFHTFIPESSSTAQTAQGSSVDHRSGGY